MKRNGFTLIELLAVIVILAIIALIATPIVLDIIDGSKESSVKRSIELYGGAVENAVAKAQLNGQAIPSGKYTTEDGKTLTQGETTLKVDYNGAKVVCEVNITTQGEISLKGCKVNGKETEYTYEKIEDANNKTYANGEVVYFDVTTGKSCDNYNEENSKTGYNGINGTENQNGCMKFYAFNDDGSDTLNLLLDHNTTALIAWNSSGSNTSGPKEVIEQLKTDTSSWVGTITSENYSIDQSDQTSKAKYTIDYSEYKARIITANEVAKITGNTTWDEKTPGSIFYFDTNTTDESTTCKSGDTSGCKYGWLYDRAKSNCTDYGCLNNSDQTTSGYWTISPLASSSVSAWGVNYDGILGANGVGYDNCFGARPVIIVSKSNLS